MPALGCGINLPTGDRAHLFLPKPLSHQGETAQPIRASPASGSIRNGLQPARAPAAGTWATSGGPGAGELLARLELKRGDHVAQFNERVVLTLLLG